MGGKPFVRDAIVYQRGHASPHFRPTMPAQNFSENRLPNTNRTGVRFGRENATHLK
jgi:hypothetical protein